MIRVEFTIDSTVINSGVMEEIRHLLRREITPMVFKVVDQLAADKNYSFSHRDVTIDGLVKME